MCDQRGVYERQQSLSQHGIETRSQARSRQSDLVAIGVGVRAGGGGVLFVAQVRVLGLRHLQCHRFGAADCHVVRSGVWLAIVHVGVAAECGRSSCLGMVLPYRAVAVFVADVRAHYSLHAA